MGANPSAGEAAGDEAARLAALRRYRILDSLPEQAYEDIVHIASTVCGTPQAAITFVDEARQWFKATVGMVEEETPRDIAFCDQAIRHPRSVTVVNDASKHPLFKAYPQVTGIDHLRFYAGAPMVTPEGQPLGTVCVMGQVPRELSPEQARALQGLSRLAVQLLELRRSELDAQRLLAERELTTQDMLLYATELEAENSELAEQARRDPLTGLLNRGGLEQAKGKGWLAGGTYTVAVLDIDFFKRINDTYGHAAGDTVIAIVGEEIRRAVRGGDVAARYGGEEFLLMMPGTPLAGAATVVDRVRQAVAARADLPTSVTLSAGLASGVAGRDAPDAVFQRADQALYQAKRRGRDRIEVAED